MIDQRRCHWLRCCAEKYAENRHYFPDHMPSQIHWLKRWSLLAQKMEISTDDVEG